LDQAESSKILNFHEAIQESLFFLIHGYNPWSRIEDGESEKSPGVTEWKKEYGKQEKMHEGQWKKAAES